jgi:hypothetical protein
MWSACRCIERLDQPQIEFVHELEVAIDLVQHRIDNERLAAASACDQVGVSARYAIEQLAKDHDSLHPQVGR